MQSRKLYKSLYFQVIVAIICGVLLGHFMPDSGTAMKPLGDGFIKLVKMMITPIIFCTVVVGIAGMEDMKKVGRVGGKALLYFEVVTTLALIIGLVVVNVLKPGAGMNVDPATLDTGAIAKYTAKAGEQSVVDFVLHIIPNSVVGAFAEGEILQVLLFSVLFGFALSMMGQSGKPVVKLVEDISHALFAAIGFIMKLAPIGAFGAMAFTIGKYGVSSLSSLAALMGSFYLTCLLFIGLVLGTITRFCGFSIWKLVRYIKEELLIVLGTSSSESALPRLMAKLEQLGCQKSVVGLVVPTGYSFNLDGTSIYLTMAAIFIAQACGIELTLTQELTIIGVLLLTSKGAAGVTGSGFITLAATLATVPDIPVAGLALILGIDRFMSEARALTNLVGNTVATVVVAKWENALDSDKLAAELHNPTPLAHGLKVEAPHLTREVSRTLS
ncbi:dicarboxylate/amino acid:cation symporter [Laribacter hongkongensis]|uniref:C4-dicarboxylate transport protein n=2 Tax=Laribacter hongkongensis TaxID=168471 RepID=DCTA_LARHH|nr:dicarboxylate/amino acid:cation symporter [Laribacter hongkongensis]C1D8S5.1 RecName: Full=C4-dicarboxylate transport protein [Laribacter hongkongensis HLHK9]ACO74865.1 Sodium:dicarboxylate symporter [Laribacter hongkongensis HLHK9]ASJ24806.1 C4-dicarboxylate transporter [Laribacter hongkongensis]MBE5527936.1 C4-dicarboxylate transporter DctA [Laribacter hongkongensis]MCG8992467.1 dicarboxylate/amino acid:cation symporter [Laribacter hongkongensis]MCG8994631.1 dicarboxylate/amino acid:cati